MALYVNSNISALNAQRQLMNSGNALDTSFKRLSSGLRINSAADDAAGFMCLAFLPRVDNEYEHPANPAHRLAHCDYAGDITAIIGRDTMVGMQFHPEKSQALGLRLIGTFLTWAP